MSTLMTRIQSRPSQPMQAMTHIIYGYPTVAESLELMQTLLEEGVEILEVQFPFSDPVADGPAIVAACHQALRQPLRVEDCLSDLGRLKRDFPNTDILLMSYLNPMYRFGLGRLIARAAEEGIAGLIIPDLPLEESDDYRALCQQHGIDPIWLVTPASPAERIADIAGQAQGLLYCVSRSGVTGQKDGSLLELSQYLASIRQHTSVPLAVGFGIRTAEQVAALQGQASIAIVGSALLEAFNQHGKDGVRSLYRTLFHG